jgi:hypothetical protein
MADEFTYDDPKSGNTRCLIGITGFSHSGKTYSALELATGAQRVYGGDIAVIDSEEAAQMYKDDFKFKHVPLDEPHDGGRWMRAMDYAYSKGARVFVLDTLSDEHIAMMERYEAALDRMAGDDWKKRERCSQAAFGKHDVKPLRAKMERQIWRMSKECCLIALWRADQKYTPKQKHEKQDQHTPADDHTWKMATTSKLMYLCTLRWLLTPGSDGVPVSLEKMGNDAERQLVKIPKPFRHLQTASQLNRKLGEQIAITCKSGNSSKPTSSAPTKLYEVTDQEGVTKDKELTPSQVESFRKRGFSVVEVPQSEGHEAAE